MTTPAQTQPATQLEHVKRKHILAEVHTEEHLLCEASINLVSQPENIESFSFLLEDTVKNMSAFAIPRYAHMLSFCLLSPSLLTSHHLYLLVASRPQSYNYPHASSSVCLKWMLTSTIQMGNDVVVNAGTAMRITRVSTNKQGDDKTVTIKDDASGVTASCLIDCFAAELPSTPQNKAVVVGTPTNRAKAVKI